MSEIYSIDDPEYQGVLFIPPDRLEPMVRTAVASGLQFTAHSVGDGAVHALLDAYEAVNQDTPIATTRPCITHSNFMSREAIDQAARLGVVLDIQPAWLYLDVRTLAAQFGNDRLRYFQPLQSLFRAGVTVGGGSDHMQKVGSLRSINPYNPFLGMWIAITRQARGFEGRLHPEEALTRGAGDSVLHDQQRPPPLPGRGGRLAGSWQVRGLRRPRPGHPELPGGRDPRDPGRFHLSQRQARL